MDKKLKTNILFHGDALDILKQFPSNSIDSVVTDPPYGLSKEPNIVEVLTKWLADEDYKHHGGGFMGKTWDSFVPNPMIWREAYRVLKPGGYALVFAGTRTQDLMTISLRLAGFEVRDVIEWLYFSGFPKNFNVSKGFNQQGNTELANKFSGFGTSLKPAHEPIIVVRKPLEGTICDNVRKYGTGAINIDRCRIGDGHDRASGGLRKAKHAENEPSFSLAMDQDKRPTGGRFPANIVTVESDAFFSKYCNVTPVEISKKVLKQDRNSNWKGEEIDGCNTHPTVKPTNLMAWLVRLVTPPNGIVLDPFAGSGSTLVAAKREGFKYIGIEKEEEYVEIAKKRLE